MVISKEAFLATDDATYEEVEIPNWGTVRVRNLSGAGRDIYMKHLLEYQADGSQRIKSDDSEARLLALTLVDEEGKLWFPKVEEGVKALRQKSVGSLQKAFTAAMKLSGLEEEDMEEAAENLEETTSEEHGSD